MAKTAEAKVVAVVRWVNMAVHLLLNKLCERTRLMCIIVRLAEMKCYRNFSSSFIGRRYEHNIRTIIRKKEKTHNNEQQKQKTSNKPKTNKRSNNPTTARAES